MRKALKNVGLTTVLVGEIFIEIRGGYGTVEKFLWKRIKPNTVVNISEIN